MEGNFDKKFLSKFQRAENKELKLKSTMKFYFICEMTQTLTSTGYFTFAWRQEIYWTRTGFYFEILQKNNEKLHKNNNKKLKNR